MGLAIDISLVSLPRRVGTAIVLAMAAGLLLIGGPTAASTAAVTTAPSRVDPQDDYPHLPRSCGDPFTEREPGLCKLNAYRQARPTVLLWGDSHGFEMLPALRVAVRDRNVNLVVSFAGSCPPMDPHLNTPDKRRNATTCEMQNHVALKYVLRRKHLGLDTKVVLGGAWHRYLTALREGTPPEESYVAKIAQDFETDTPRLFRRLGLAKISTDVVGQVLTVPEGAVCPRGRDPFVCSLPRSQAIPSEGANKRWVKNAMRPLVGNARYLSVNGAVCTVRVCRGKINGIYTFFDDLHISATRSRTLAGYFKLSVGDVAGG